MGSARDWTRVKDVLQTTLDQPAAERSRFAQEACAGDSALLAEVQSLLLAHERAGSFAERPAVQVLAETISTQPATLRTRLVRPGDRLGPYEILDCIGVGGMGEVYTATDTRLHRTVAVKVLPRRSDGLQLREQFEREARAVAALRHPHVCVLHDIGTTNEVEYLVMEYLDGETLGDRIAKGPLPVADVLRIATEIGDALAETHRHGIVHRDLKPSNIMLTASGAKLLDFGVAKLRLGPSSPQRIEVGVGYPSSLSSAFGTPRYMAPEQFTGNDVDGRTDIFALGAVLYEMVTGEKAFQGDTPLTLSASILEHDPAPIPTHGSSLLESLDRLIRRCLEKDPANRWQSARDLTDALRGVVATPLLAESPSLRRRNAWVLSAALTALVVGGTTIWRAGLVDRLLPKPALEARAEPLLVVGNMQQLTADDVLNVDPVISPDGASIAYASGTAQGTRVFIRPISGGRAVPVSEKVSGFEYQPRWSPDGTRMLYITNTGVFVAIVSAHTSQLVASDDAIAGTYSSTGSTGSPRGGVSGAAWSPDGRDIAVAYGGTLAIVALDEDAAPRGPPRPVARSQDDLHQCDWSPNGKWIACASGNWTFTGPSGQFGNLAPSAIALIAVDGGAIVTIVPRMAQNRSPVWALDSRHLYFVSNQQGSTGDIYSIEVFEDASASDQVRVTAGLGVASISFSHDRRRMAYAASSSRANIWTLPIPRGGAIDASGAQAVTAGDQIVEFMRVSSDRQWLVYDSKQHGNVDIFRVPVAGGQPKRLTDHAADDFAPDLSPDGRLLAYHSWRTGSRDIFVQPLDGGVVEQVTRTAGQESYPQWFPDGPSLLILDQVVERGVRRGYFVVHRNDSHGWDTPVPFEDVELPTGISSLKRSRDGRFYVYLRAGAVEISWLKSRERKVLYHPPAPATKGGVRQVQVSEDSQTVFFKYFDADGRPSFWSVPTSGGRPRLLVRFNDPLRTSNRADFAVGDGRFYFTIDERRSQVWVADVTE